MSQTVSDASHLVPPADLACCAMKVEMLNAGWFTAAAGIWRRDDDLDRQVRFPIPAYVIETAEERILVDTGLHPAAVADPARHYGSPTRSACSSSSSSEHRRADRPVHDHQGRADPPALRPRRRPGAAAALGAGRRAAPRVGGGPRRARRSTRNFYLPVDYAAVGDQVVLVDGDHDLLGDGSIELLLTPGHTPGHQSVRVGERLVIGGDVTHFASGLDDHRFPIFADDFAAQAASADRLRALRDAGAVVRPGHDPAVLVPGPVSA